LPKGRILFRFLLICWPAYQRDYTQTVTGNFFMRFLGGKTVNFKTTYTKVGKPLRKFRYGITAKNYNGQPWFSSFSIKMY